jgi:hypothetical protein
MFNFPRRAVGHTLTSIGLVCTLTSFAITPTVQAKPMCDDPEPPPICNPKPTPAPKPAPAPAPNPVGVFAFAERLSGQIRVKGWASDGNAPNTAMQVTFAIDGAEVGAVTGAVPQIDPATKQLASNFDGVVPFREGSQLCATAKNVGPGADTRIGCMPVPPLRVLTLSGKSNADGSGDIDVSISNLPQPASETASSGAPTGTGECAAANARKVRRQRVIPVLRRSISGGRRLGGGTGPIGAGHVLVRCLGGATSREGASIAR